MVVLPLLALVWAIMVGVPGLTPGGTSVPGQAGPAATGDAADLLATLPVKGKAAKTGYDRTGEFGSAWRDVDDNGCDTRNDILARDLTAIVTDESCRVLSGILLAPYTGESVTFVRGETTSMLVQIDHLVALSNAWQTGAQQLDRDERIALANDPLNLLASDGASNSQKGDGDAATWLPAQKSFRCAYVSRQISVKATYGLWVAPAEHDAMVRVLATCPGQPAFAAAQGTD
ncbi:MAG TPA: HNH endonuclease family protein [Cryobacterium sp.]|nr:HNH endonuclease family protein [Cryobacterium sp.]